MPLAIYIISYIYSYTESKVLLETHDAELLQEEEAEAKAVTEKERPGLTMFT